MEKSNEAKNSRNFLVSEYVKESTDSELLHDLRRIKTELKEDSKKLTAKTDVFEAILNEVVLRKIMR